VTVQYSSPELPMPARALNPPRYQLRAALSVPTSICSCRNDLVGSSDWAAMPIDAAPAPAVQRDCERKVEAPAHD